METWGLWGLDERTAAAAPSLKDLYDHYSQWESRWRGVEHSAATRPWSDSGYPLQHHDTKHLIEMFHNLDDAHRGGEPEMPGETWSTRRDNYAAELLDRHEAGDPEATHWAGQKSYVAPDYMTHEDWDRDYRQVYPEDYPADPRV